MENSLPQLTSLFYFLLQKHFLWGSTGEFTSFNQLTSNKQQQNQLSCLKKNFFKLIPKKKLLKKSEKVSCEKELSKCAQFFPQLRKKFVRATPIDCILSCWLRRGASGWGIGVICVPRTWGQTLQQPRASQSVEWKNSWKVELWANNSARESSLENNCYWRWVFFLHIK